MECDQSWESAEVVFGRLIEINKESSILGIEIEEIDPESERLTWVRHCYDLPEDYSDEDYEQLLNDLGKDVRVNLIDGEVREIVRT